MPGSSSSSYSSSCVRDRSWSFFSSDQLSVGSIHLDSQAQTLCKSPARRVGVGVGVNFDPFPDSLSAPTWPLSAAAASSSSSSAPKTFLSWARNNYRVPSEGHRKQWTSRRPSEIAAGLYLLLPTPLCVCVCGCCSLSHNIISILTFILAICSPLLLRALSRSFSLAAGSARQSREAKRWRRRQKRHRQRQRRWLWWRAEEIACSREDKRSTEGAGCGLIPAAAATTRRLFSHSMRAFLILLAASQ